MLKRVFKTYFEQNISIFSPFFFILESDFIFPFTFLVICCCSVDYGERWTKMHARWTIEAAELGDAYTNWGCHIYNRWVGIMGYQGETYKIMGWRYQLGREKNIGSQGGWLGSSNRLTPVIRLAHYSQPIGWRESSDFGNYIFLPAILYSCPYYPKFLSLLSYGLRPLSTHASSWSVTSS